ncbi:MAG: hydantoinase B/oxoprolinase family protein [Gammaproteobacteria bacterium]|nr:hydantoinase B/oxoprolinase family protein [Gammaproteobacteria bacterium]
MPGAALPDADEQVTRCDPVSLEVIRGVLQSSQQEMEALIERTAMSGFIREKKDFFVALFDAAGDLVMGAYRPSFGDPVRPVFEHYPAADMRAGDLYWYNDCYGSKGSVSHSPDQVFLAPVFVDGELLAFAQSWAHFADIGGMRPGSISPDCVDIFQEGIIVPPVRLAREGVVNQELLRLFVRNSRFPEMLRGDLRACIAAVRLGERRLLELARRFRPAVIRDAFVQLAERSERAARERLRKTFQPGRYQFSDALDHDGQGNGPYWMRLALEVGPDRTVLDLTASDDQAPGPINYLLNPAVPRAMFGMYLLAGEPTLPLNSGAGRALDEVLLREGSLLQPSWPAPLGQRGLTMMRLLSSCMGLVNAAGGEATAANCAYVIYFARGLDEEGVPFLMSDGLGVGYGARADADGIDSVYYVAQENFPVEMLELDYPVRIRAYGVHRDSGGAGRWRGGVGVVRELEVLAERVTFSIRIDGVRMPAWGVKGGLNGGSGRAVVNPGTNRERILDPFSDGNVLERGEVLRLETGGGGGWGHPFDREPERVLDDVRNGYVSVRSAAEAYGVAVLDDGEGVDATRTAALRKRRPPVEGLFHRHVYKDALE